jgi:hypothetical protein
MLLDEVEDEGDEELEELLEDELGLDEELLLELLELGLEDVATEDELELVLEVEDEVVVVPDAK